MTEARLRPGVADAPPSDGGPSMLDLVRLSPRLLFPPGGLDLLRQIALLTDLSPDDEVLVAGCGNGAGVEHFVTEYGVHGAGVDTDGHLVAAAEDRARERGLANTLQFQHGSAERLPYRDEIFDVAIGELGLTHEADPASAVRELVRVTRPGGAVVLVQLVWKAAVDETRRRVLSRHLGVQPLMLVEWKRMLREAGVEHLHTEDWSDEETAFRPGGVKPFPDFAELFSVPEKLGILRRAWRRWGWRGVREALVREREVHRLLTRERVLGLDLVKGVKPAEAAEGDAAEPTESARGGPAGGADVGDAPDDRSLPGEAHADEGPADAPTTERPHRQTEGLPLFGREDDNA